MGRSALPFTRGADASRHHPAPSGRGSIARRLGLVAERRELPPRASPPSRRPSPDVRLSATTAVEENSLLMLIKARVEGTVQGLRAQCNELAERCAAAEQLVTKLQADARAAALAAQCHVNPAAPPAHAWHAAAADAVAHAAVLAAERVEHIAALAALRAEHARALDTALSVSQRELAALLASASSPATDLLTDRSRSGSRIRDRAAHTAHLTDQLDAANETCTVLTSERDKWREEAAAAQARAEDEARASLSTACIGAELEAAKAECAALTVTLTQCTTLSTFAEELQAAHEACAALTSERDHWRAEATALRAQAPAPVGRTPDPHQIDRASELVGEGGAMGRAGAETESRDVPGARAQHKMRDTTRQSLQTPTKTPTKHGSRLERASPIVGESGGEERAAAETEARNARGSTPSGVRAQHNTKWQSLQSPTQTLAKPAAVSEFFAERRSRTAAPTSARAGRSADNSPLRSPGRGVELLDEVLAAQRRMATTIAYNV